MWPICCNFPPKSQKWRENPKNGGKSKAMHMLTNKTRQLPQVDYLFVIAVHGDPYFYVLHMHGFWWGGMHGCWGRHAWLLAGGVHGCWWGGVWLLGACVVAGGGHVWLLVGGVHGCWGGMCGCWGGIHRIWWYTVNERVVCILLECILVFF